MSGWMNTKNVGTAAAPTTTPVVRHSPIRRDRPARTPARKSARSSFANSEGWKRKKPKSIQRVEPRTPVDRPEPERKEPGERAEHHPVEPAQEPDDADSFGSAAPDTRS